MRRTIEVDFGARDAARRVSATDARGCARVATMCPLEGVTHVKGSACETIARATRGRTPMGAEGWDHIESKLAGNLRRKEVVINATASRRSSMEPT